MEAIDKDDFTKLESAFKDAPDDNKYCIRKHLLKNFLDKEPKSFTKYVLSYITGPIVKSWENLKAEALNICGTDDAVSHAITREASKPDFSDWMKLQLPKFIDYFSCQVKNICLPRKIFEDYAKQMGETFN